MTQYENWNLILRWNFQELSEANPEPCQTSKKELFVKIAFAAKNFKACLTILRHYALQLLSIFAKSSEDWYDSHHACLYFQQIYSFHCVKSVQIQSFFCSVLSCIQSKYRKIRTRKNSVFRHFSRSVLFNFLYEARLQTIKNIPAVFMKFVGWFCLKVADLLFPCK